MKLLSILIASFLSSAALADCLAPWGGFISENTSVTAYYKDYPQPGERCQSEWRTCINGYLTGFYQYQSCHEDMGCQTSFGYIPNYGSVRAYKEMNPSRGERCQSEIRYCQNGFFTGSYSYSSCYEN